MAVRKLTGLQRRLVHVKTEERAERDVQISRGWVELVHRSRVEMAERLVLPTSS